MKEIFVILNVVIGSNVIPFRCCCRYFVRKLQVLKSFLVQKKSK